MLPDRLNVIIYLSLFKFLTLFFDIIYKFYNIFWYYSWTYFTIQLIFNFLFLFYNFNKKNLILTK